MMLFCMRHPRHRGGSDRDARKNGEDVARAGIPVFSPAELLVVAHADPQ